MALISSSIESLAYVEESVWGVTPATPAFQNLRFVPPATFSGSVESITSAEKRGDRNPTDTIVIGSGAAGTMNIEMSYGTYDDFLAAALCGEWNDTELENGTEIISYTLERKIPTGLSTADYYRYTGMRVNGFSLSCVAREVASGSFDFVGKSELFADTAIAGSTYGDAGDANVLNCTSDFAGLTIGSISGVHLLSVTMNLDNGITQHYAIGDRDPVGVTLGQFTITGSIEAYYESKDLYKALIEETDVSLGFTLGKTTGGKYTFSLPRIKLAGGEMPLADGDEPIKMSLDWAAMYDGTEKHTIKITKVAP